MSASITTRTGGAMRLFHYTRPSKLLWRVQNNAQNNGRFDKPRGLWISVEGTDANGDALLGWPHWCVAESYGGNPLEWIRYEIILHETTRVLWIDNSLALDEFTLRYHRRTGGFFNGIDWIDVAQEYDGIIIAPYLWSRRLDDNVSWYYSWDCASGCIWRRRAIADVIEREKITPDELKLMQEAF